MGLTLRQILKEKREKQIEEITEMVEMAREIYEVLLDCRNNSRCRNCEFRNDTSMSFCKAEYIAKVLSEKYQPKLPEDSVVLTKEEYEKLNTYRVFIKPKQLTNGELAEKLKNKKYGIIGVDESSIEIIPTRAEIEKETAEKILKDVKQKAEYCYLADYNDSLNDEPFIEKSDFLKLLQEIANREGVEIKE